MSQKFQDENQSSLM